MFTANTSDTRADDIRPSLALTAGYDFGNNFYTGVDYTTGRFGGQSKAQGELVVNAGYGQELPSGVSYDLNVSRSAYPRSGSDNYNELGLTLGYGAFAATYAKAFDSDGFVKDTAYLDLTLTYALTGQVETYITATKSDDASLGIELGASYDLGSGLSASATYEKGATPKMVLGLSKSFQHHSHLFGVNW